MYVKITKFFPSMPVSLTGYFIILIYSQGLKYSITFISIVHMPQDIPILVVYDGCLSHEPSLMALAPASLL